MMSLRLGLATLLVAPVLSGCVVARTTGAVVGVAGAAAGTAVKTTGRAVDAAIPDDDDERDEDGGSGGGYTRADAEADARNLR